MSAMQGKSTKSEINKKKRKYKEREGLSDGDTTPSDFDENDSDLDSDSQEDDSDWSDNPRDIELLISLNFTSN